ncbi:MAG: hypothetical protein HY747_10505, partial [Elusimicrobia bacterium]|nr:hypothetical protein [Elusimicrobiota bacterium]
MLSLLWSQETQTPRPLFNKLEAKLRAGNPQTKAFLQDLLEISRTRLEEKILSQQENNPSRDRHAEERFSQKLGEIMNRPENRDYIPDFQTSAQGFDQDAQVTQQRQEAQQQVEQTPRDGQDLWSQLRPRSSAERDIIRSVGLDPDCVVTRTADGQCLGIPQSWLYDPETKAYTPFALAIDKARLEGKSETVKGIILEAMGYVRDGQDGRFIPNTTPTLPSPL